jgi:HSP20 family protein
MEDVTSITLRRLQGRLGNLAYQFTHLSFSRPIAKSGWEPALNLFLCQEQVTICMELAGVERDDIDLQVQAKNIVVRGQRVAPQPCGGELQAKQVLVMEIDHGRFERDIDLPVEVDPEKARAEQRNGFLWIYLPFRAEG